MSRIITFFNTDSLKGRLRYFIVNLLLSVILAITIFLIFMTKSQLNTTYKEELNAIVKLQSQSVEKWINERELDIKFLSSHSHDNEESIKSFLEDFVLNQSEFYSISYVDKLGRTVIDSTFDIKHDFGEEEFFLDSLDGIDSISDVRISPDGQMPIIYFASPILDEFRDVSGVIIGTVRLSSIQNLVEDFRFSQTGETFIINAENKLLTKRKYEDIKILKEISGNYRENGFYTNYAGDEVLGVSTTALFDRWTIVAQMSTTEMYKVFKKFLIYISIFVVILLVMVIPIILHFSNKIERPLKSLLKGSKTIENGEYGHNIDFESITHSTLEIRELTHSFNSMSNKLHGVIGELKLSSTIDVLSQLYNRRELMRLTQCAYEKEKLNNTQFSIMMIDIDYFKKINDNYGHRIGDVAISMIANVIKTSLSANDIAGRYGGEEFLVWVANTDFEESKKIAERILKNVKKLVISCEDINFSCTCSIGLYYKDDYGVESSLTEMIDLSDKALYKAKDMGRNKVVAINDNSYQY